MGGSWNGGIFEGFAVVRGETKQKRDRHALPHVTYDAMLDGVRNRQISYTLTVRIEDAGAQNRVHAILELGTCVTS